MRSIRMCACVLCCAVLWRSAADVDTLQTVCNSMLTHYIDFVCSMMTRANTAAVYSIRFKHLSWTRNWCRYDEHLEPINCRCENEDFNLATLFLSRICLPTYTTTPVMIQSILILSFSSFTVILFIVLAKWHFRESNILFYGMASFNHLHSVSFYRACSFAEWQIRH